MKCGHTTCQPGVGHGLHRRWAGQRPHGAHTQRGRRVHSPLPVPPRDRRVCHRYHAARARGRQCPRARQSRPGPGLGRPSRRRTAPDPRSFQRAGRGLGGRDAGAEGGVRTPPRGALRRDASGPAGHAHAGQRRGGRRGTHRRRAAARREPVLGDARSSLRRPRDAQHRHHGVRLDEAERESRPRPRPDRARAARPGARRGSAVHDAGEHVQLRSRLRRRRGRCVRRHALGGGDPRPARGARPARGTGRLRVAHGSRRHPRGDRAGRTGLRGDRRHRAHAP